MREGTVALTVVDLARQGRFAEIEALFAPPLRAVVSADTVRLGWESESARIGAVTTVGDPVPEPAAGGLVRVVVAVTGERGGLTVAMSVDETGRLHGLRLAPPAGPAWAPPRYAKPRRFTEQEVTLGEGAHAVPGTLTLPRRRGSRTGVVLLAGGGPFDRDGTAGPAKPLKDLAWGLAGRGVAVVRFDKLTQVYARTASEPGFTMVDEYVPHAVAAIRLLQEHCASVFVLGHSAGGRVAPRVAAAEPSVAGLVILAGDAAPLGQAAIRVARHLATEHGDGVAALTRQVALADSPDLSPSTAAAELPFGWPASYWLDLRGYDQVGTAAALDKPMLILQGGRDYQVTVEDDLARWQAGLAHRPDVTFRVYDADDHFFFREREQHVDPAVVADIAAWLTRKP